MYIDYTTKLSSQLVKSECKLTEIHSSDQKYLYYNKH